MLRRSCLPPTATATCSRLSAPAFSTSVSTFGPVPSSFFYSARRTLSVSSAASAALNSAVGANKNPLEASLEWFHNFAGGNAVVSLGIGATLLTGGIILINLAERRDAVQQHMDDVVEPLVCSLTDDEDDGGNNKGINKVFFASDKELDGLIFHAAGPVRSKAPWPRDEDLGIHAPNQLRMRRHVEMYQLEEKADKQKDKEGREYTSYSYKEGWFSAAQECRGDRRNPKFPLFIPIQEAQELNMIVQSRPKPVATATTSDSGKEQRTATAAKEAPKEVQLLLSYDFAERLTDFEKALFKTATDCSKTGGSDDENSSYSSVSALLESFGPGKPFQKARDSMDLCPSKDNSMLLSCGAEGSKPQVGDLRVWYEVVKGDKPYTALGQYNYRAADASQEGMVSIAGNVKQSLARSFGELVVPEEANVVARQAAKQAAAAAGVGQGALDLVRDFRIELPEPLIDVLEMALLTIEPISFGFIEKGSFPKATAFRDQRTIQGEKTNQWFKVGVSSCGLAGCLIAGTATSSPAILATGLSAGIGVAYSTRKGARMQIHSKIERYGSLGKARRTRDGFEL